MSFVNWRGALPPIFIFHFFVHQGQLQNQRAKTATYGIITVFATIFVCARVIFHWGFPTFPKFCKIIKSVLFSKSYFPHFQTSNSCSWCCISPQSCFTNVTAPGALVCSLCFVLLVETVAFSYKRLKALQNMFEGITKNNYKKCLKVLQINVRCIIKKTIKMFDVYKNKQLKTFEGITKM